MCVGVQCGWGCAARATQRGGSDYQKISTCSVTVCWLGGVPKFVSWRDKTTIGTRVRVPIHHGIPGYLYTVPMYSIQVCLTITYVLSRT